MRGWRQHKFPTPKERQVRELNARLDRVEARNAPAELTSQILADRAAARLEAARTPTEHGTSPAYFGTLQEVRVDETDDDPKLGVSIGSFDDDDYDLDRFGISHEVDQSWRD